MRNRLPNHVVGPVSCILLPGFSWAIEDHDHGDEDSVCEALTPMIACLCGQPFVKHLGTASTCVGFRSPPGHDHDDNCQHRTYVCRAGHETEVYRQRRCKAPGCTWRGQTTCYCHKDPCWTEWPELRK